MIRAAFRGYRLDFRGRNPYRFRKLFQHKATVFFLLLVWIIRWVIFPLISPTFLISDIRKRAAELTPPHKPSMGRALALKRQNTIHLSISLIASLVIWIGMSLPGRTGLSYHPWLFAVAILLICWFALSRCLEILVAFYRDAYHQSKSGNKGTKSSLRLHHRTQLALRSYVELIFDFALLHFALDQRNIEMLEMDLGLRLPFLSSALFEGGFLDALYFSGVTISTLGYGDYSPSGAFPRMMVLLQVITGILLLVVCFSLYIRSQDPHCAVDPKRTHGRPPPPTGRKRMKSRRRGRYRTCWQGGCVHRRGWLKDLVARGFEK